MEAVRFVGTVGNRVSIVIQGNGSLFEVTVAVFPFVVMRDEYMIVLNNFSVVMSSNTELYPRDAVPKERYQWS